MLDHKRTETLIFLPFFIPFYSRIFIFVPRSLPESHSSSLSWCFWVLFLFPKMMPALGSLPWTLNPPLFPQQILWEKKKRLCWCQGSGCTERTWSKICPYFRGKVDSVYIFYLPSFFFFKGWGFWREQNGAFKWRSWAWARAGSATQVTDTERYLGSNWSCLLGIGLGIGHVCRVDVIDQI